MQYVFKSIGIYLARRKSIFTNLGEEVEDRALLRDFNVHYFKAEKERRRNYAGPQASSTNRVETSNKDSLGVELYDNAYDALQYAQAVGPRYTWTS